ncbi:MAG TPA: hypothetical protein VK684_01900 [Edaphobacter sp.]|nr:hypothetical protein [Edaphobacter sp.]
MKLGAPEEIVDKSTEKVVGILGDSLTLVGSVVLALEALLRRWRTTRDRTSTKAVWRFGRHRIAGTDRHGKPITPQSIEDEAINIGQWLGIIGVSLLVTGFCVLLAIRIWGD